MEKACKVSEIPGRLLRSLNFFFFFLICLPRIESQYKLELSSAVHSLRFTPRMNHKSECLSMQDRGAWGKAASRPWPHDGRNMYVFVVLVMPRCNLFTCLSFPPPSSHITMAKLLHLTVTKTWGPQCENHDLTLLYA